MYAQKKHIKNKSSEYCKSKLKSKLLSLFLNYRGCQSRRNNCERTCQRRRVICNHGIKHNVMLSGRVIKSKQYPDNKDNNDTIKIQETVALYGL